MGFADLPDDWATRPVTDPALTADVVDLCVSDRDRMVGALAFLVCDEQDRLLQPLSMSELDGDVPRAERQLAFQVVLEALGGTPVGLLVCRARPGSPQPTDDDRLWHQVAIEALTGSSARLLGFHVATRHGVVELPPPLRATA